MLLTPLPWFQAKDKERRERVRAIRIKEAQEEYEARLLRSMERAAAPVKKKTVGWSASDSWVHCYVVLFSEISHLLGSNLSLCSICIFIDAHTAHHNHQTVHKRITAKS